MVVFVVIENVNPPPLFFSPPSPPPSLPLPIISDVKVNDPFQAFHVQTISCNEHNNLSLGAGVSSLFVDFHYLELYSLLQNINIMNIPEKAHQLFSQEGLCLFKT